MSTYPTRAEVEAIRDAAVAALTDAMTNAKPTYNIDGQQISWAQHRTQLQDSIKWCADTLRAIDDEEGGGACEETIVV